ncbi:MAG: hypothetical protein KatS3mg115_1259 [Candidatus Poribacteria bacterium]|nr:MAG: hypothetical protein KatS3mg115_1259 [Candidatus Poribacteria bacterium]
MRHHVFLVPGYFGHRGSWRGVGYWDGVIPILQEAGLVPHPVRTEPAGAPEVRARRLAEAIESAAAAGNIGAGDALHLLGHSAGGVAARYLVSPATRISLPVGLREQIRTVATIATPHYGTPLADFYASWQAEELLGLIARWGRRWTSEERVRSLMDWLHRARPALERRLPEGMAEELERLLEAVAESPELFTAEAQEYLSSLAAYRGALPQLRTRSMAQFNGVVVDAPNVRYLCYLTGLLPPRSWDLWTRWFALASFLSTRWGRWQPPPLPNGGLIPPEKVVLPDGGRPSEPVRISRRHSDGVVPTASQLWGTFRLYAPVDHHASIGRLPMLPELGFREKGGLRAFYLRIAQDLIQLDG